MSGEYSEIPGVYTPSPRPFASMRRSFRTYRWFFIATTVVVLIVVISTFLSFMIGEAVDPDETSERNGDKADVSEEEHRNQTLNRLLSLSWPRRVNK
ncbi:hypothetical protein Anas_08562 [Armadillidium nasatum]|uniref:Uncharacterized protein n=1 Tax=Armadillidium nasatum TaxID=96803 RepID=A0A5N5T838_9CRUS|nr:hypothetical protein Anas_08562 [Armadillidium nasatum]